jgi:hypothetical protein
MKKKCSKDTSFPLFPNYYKYQLNERLDFWSYRVISLRFTVSTMDILYGAVWAIFNI